MHNKRGLSPVITTLLVVVLVLVAVGIVWGVIRNIIIKGGEDISLEKLTVDASIKSVGVDEVNNNISVLVRRNPGRGDVAGFKFVFSDGTVNEVVTRNTPFVELEERWFSFHLVMNVSEVLTISLVPLIKSGDK